MPFDYKKEYREFYLPKAKPELIDVPEMHYIAIRGAGDPNAEGGAYQAAIQVLYALAYTIKMSKKGDHQIAGVFRLRGAAAGGLLVSGEHGRRGLQPKSGFPLDLRHSSA